ncbi:response regulator [Leeia aquatica]|uniref:Response regulator n=1 Tax=Leeia aquatica TaxID=2725557 RepID=A0A847SAN3_9NEIS|nr:response regulator [Leeia aquatica]NLR76793.1 response regulator [Leeia aquatica]
MAGKPTVLIIDDDTVLRSLMSSILRQEEYVVCGEASAADAGLKLCEQLKPGIVLLDINLPDHDGLEVLPEMLQMAHRPKVIMVSGEATMERVRAALGAGASGFVVKPLNAAKLIAAMEHALKSRAG